MPQIITGRDGALTALTIIAADAAQAEQIENICSRYTTRIVKRDGSEVRVSCKRLEAENICRTVNALPTPAAPAALAPAPRARSWAARVVVAEFETAPATMVGQNGTTLRLTGYGAPFVGGEMHGPLWGSVARYAYYA